MASVSLERVTKRFGSVVAVDDLSLEIADREFLVLLGPSGCGKSTVLRMIAGLEQPTSGTVFIGGVDVTGVDPKSRDIAMVFQSYALYPHRTARQNIEIPLVTRHVPKDVRRRRVDEAASALDLLDVLDRKPGQLSGGQRQRVALARAMVRDPAVFLMDEPLSNLDAKLRVHTRAELTALHDEFQATFVYVTHDQVEAMSMGDRVAVLDKGVLQQVGPPQEVYDRPASVFVAQFVGSPAMNLMPGRIEDGRVVVPGGWLPLPPGAAGEPGEVVAGVRAEHFHIDGEGSLEATVRLVESLGHERHVLCRGASEAMELIVRVPSDDAVPATGAHLRLGVSHPSRVHLFDPTTGARRP